MILRHCDVVRCVEVLQEPADPYSETPMRIAVASTALALAIAACHEGPTSPFSRPSGPAPSGLPTTLSITPSTATPFAGPAIVADGDSVVASAEYDVTGCLDYVAVAGTAGTSVVVTVIESSPLVVRYCTMDKKSAIVRAVVRPAPRGAYAVVLRRRLDFLSDGTEEAELARGAVTLP